MQWRPVLFSRNALRNLSGFQRRGQYPAHGGSSAAVLPKLAETWEIILVNDGSRDATTPICDELAEQYPEVRAIHHTDNRGYGAALKSGILAARYDYIFFTDSDGQFDLQELENLIEWASHYDIVTGYRAKRQDPPASAD